MLNYIPIVLSISSNQVENPRKLTPRPNETAIKNGRLCLPNWAEHILLHCLPSQTIHQESFMKTRLCMKTGVTGNWKGK